VPRTLSAFACDLLPCTKDVNQGMDLLQDICELMSFIARHRPRQSNFDFVYTFVEQFIFVHGGLIDLSLYASPVTSSTSDRTRKVAEILKGVMLGTISTTQDTLGRYWVEGSEQKNGQSASESKILTPVKPKELSSVSVRGLFSMLSAASETCPMFVVHLPSLEGKDYGDDSLIRRAIQSSVVVLSDPPSPVALGGAMRFLMSMVCLLQLLLLRR